MKTNEKLQVLIEIPKGSRNKYELSKKTGLMMLDRVLPESMDYPADYGFILGTNAPDGDELDVFVLISNPTFSGCLIEARPIGVLKMKDERGTDDKILAVAIKDQTYSNIK
jgi:inorganic pyrophosphatase